MKKWTFKEVNNYVIRNSNCKLLSKEYINNTGDLQFECECGKEFTTSFAKFKDRGKRQCNKCGRNQTREFFSFDYEYIKKFISDNSDCELLSEKYINNSEPLLLKCKCGKIFTTTFAKFKDRNKRQCTECGNEKRREYFSFDIEEVKDILEEYDCKLLSKKYINANEEIEIQCSCGEIFKTTLYIFQKGKNRCDVCTKRMSNLEQTINEYLNNNKYYYSTQYVFDDCKYINTLPFDFAVFEDEEKSKLKCLIEVDGIQHFEPIDYFGGKDAFEKQLLKDNIKNEYCYNNDIKLIRLPYYQVDNFKNMLKECI